MRPSQSSAIEILKMEETRVPFILRFIEKLTRELGAKVHGYNVDASAGGERKWTHYDDSSGIFSTESDSTTDG